MENLGVNLGFIIVYTLSFAILFVVLRAWLYQPILKMLDRRRQTIAQGLEDARVAAEARANAEKEASQIITEAQTRAQHIVRESEERAEQVAREIRNEADLEAGKARESALADVQLERDRILAELRAQVANLAIAAAERVVGNSLDEKSQRVFLDEFFSGVRAGRVPALQEVRLDGQAAEVTSALPLTPDEQEAVKRDVMRGMGGGSITFRVDPDILGGLVVRIGDQVVDASVNGRLQNLRESLA